MYFCNANQNLNFFITVFIISI